jgi:hypothetical protein
VTRNRLCEAVNDEVIERLAVSRVLHGNSNNSSVLKCGGRFLPEERAEIYGDGNAVSE